MKLLSIICVLIIAALNMVPCADVHDEKVSTSSISASGADSHHNTAHGDLCTPFCHCGCCGSHVVAQTGSWSVVNAAVHGQDRLFYVTRHCPNVSQSIWQPPKLIS